MRKLTEWMTVFLIGGALYSMLEILWRGYTHWSMTITGGICFAALYALHVYGTAMPFFLRCLLGAVSITAAELAAGCIVNLWLGWEVWDYSGVRGNLLGQICLPFSVLWLLLCALAAPLCRHLGHCLRRQKDAPALASPQNPYYNEGTTSA